MTRELRFKNIWLKWARKVINPATAFMWIYGKEDIDKRYTWDLSVLRAKVQTANQLGHDVLIKYEDGSLVVLYVESRPSSLPDIR